VVQGETSELCELARSKGAFFMEGLWTRAFPATRKVSRAVWGTPFPATRKVSRAVWGTPCLYAKCNLHGRCARCFHPARSATCHT
jgi:hypothetical protein